MAAAESESDVQQHIQIAAVHYNCFLMRNNSGALKDMTGRLVRYGLGNVSKQHNDKIKSSDLIGFTIIGARAIFTAIEVKAPGWKMIPSDKRAYAQKNFIDWVNMHGGIAGFCTNVDDFKALMTANV